MTIISVMEHVSLQIKELHRIRQPRDIMNGGDVIQALGLVNAELATVN